MNTTKIVALVLMLGGALALIYGGFTYTKSSDQVKLGPIELTVKDRETVSIPIWAGVTALVLGGGLLVWGGKR